MAAEVYTQLRKTFCEVECTLPPPFAIEIRLAALSQSPSRIPSTRRRAIEEIRRAKAVKVAPVYAKDDEPYTRHT
jgi:hypothetical protein